MAEQDFEQKRRFYRLNYPSTDRPVVTIRKKTFDALDVSEEGIRFLLGDDRIIEFKEGERLAGRVVFGERGAHEFKAEVLRLTEDACVIRLFTLIPLPLIMSEQRYLLQKYKNI